MHPLSGNRKWDIRRRLFELKETINKEYLDQYLSKFYGTVIPDYDYKIYYHFDGFLVEELSKELSLNNDEFLQITEIYVNEDDVIGTI